MGLNGATPDRRIHRRFCGRLDRPFGCGIGDHLYGGDHVAGSHHGVGGERRHRHGFVDQVHRIDSGRIQDHETGALRVKIGAPGEGGAKPDPIARERRRDTGGRDILRDVAGLQPGDRHLRDSGGGKRIQIGFPEQPPFLE